MDQASDTVYVEVGPVGDASFGSLAMISGATCNVNDQAGCGLAPATTPDGSGAIAMAENPFTRTVYAVNEEDDDMSVIDAATCNATDHAGCLQTPPALAIGGQTTAQVTPSSDNGAGAVAVDPTTDTLYATSQDENNVSILNGATCNGAHHLGLHGLCTHDNGRQRAAGRGRGSRHEHGLRLQPQRRHGLRDQRRGLQRVRSCRL